MKVATNIGLNDVQAVYSGPEGILWELVMGEQIHIGGFQSSTDLAQRANIQAGANGVDFCCCNGAGMRFLVKFHNVGSMIGVDATPTVVESGKQRCSEGAFNGKIRFVLADVCNSGLPSCSADFVWGEDAWCYVVDKPCLIAEAARIVKSGGTIAFTDWVEGPKGLEPGEADRFLRFMKFPSIPNIGEYAKLLEENGCEVLVAEDTGRFAPHVNLYLDMLNMQLTYDALKIIGFDTDLMAVMAGEMNFMRDLAEASKIAQGIFIARRK